MSSLVPTHWWRHLSLILLAGLAARLLFLPLAGSRYDNYLFQRWGDLAVAGGLPALYLRDDIGLNYPPAYLYLLAGDGLIHREQVRAGGRVWLPGDLDPFFFMLHKLNSVGADLAAALLLAWAGRRLGHPGPALAGAAAYALSPALVYTTAYWGQVDGVVLALLIAAACAIRLARPGLAGAALALALATKAQAGLFVPVLGLYLLAEGWAAGGSGRQAAIQAGQWAGRAGAAAGAVGIAVFAPLLLSAAGTRVFAPYTGAVGLYDWLSLNAFNGWWIAYGDGAGGVHDTQVLWGGLSARTLGLAALVLALAAILLLYGRALRRAQATPDGSRRRAEATALAWAACAWAFFLLPSQIHERYALYVLPPLLLAALWQPAGRGGWAQVWLVGGLICLNLYYINPVFPLSEEATVVLGNVIGRGVALLFFVLAGVGVVRLTRLGWRDARHDP